MDIVYYAAKGFTCFRQRPAFKLARLKEATNKQNQIHLSKVLQEWVLLPLKRFLHFTRQLLFLLHGVDTYFLTTKTKQNKRASFKIYNLISEPKTFKCKKTQK